MTINNHEAFQRISVRKVTCTDNITLGLSDVFVPTQRVECLIYAYAIVIRAIVYIV